MTDTKSDIQLMRERLQRNLGWTDEQIEQDIMWRELNRPVRTPMQTLFDNIRERAGLMKQTNDDDFINK